MSSATANSPVSRAAMYFGLLGGSGAWTAHLLLAYLIAEFACETGTDRYATLGLTLPAWLIIGMSIVMLALAALATVVALKTRRRLHPLAGSRDRSITADLYMARTGVMASGLFGFIIVVQSVPIFFYLRSC